VNDLRKVRISAPTLALAIFAVTAVWYAALILDLQGVPEFIGLHFFWTAVLGLGPFVCLALSAMLADAYVFSDHSRIRLVCAAVATGLSPWLLWAMQLWVGVR
jgi:hypothetical protein